MRFLTLVGTPQASILFATVTLSPNKQYLNRGNLNSPQLSMVSYRAQCKNSKEMFANIGK